MRSTLLARAAIEVKDVSGRVPGGAAHLRVAVRRPEENQVLLDALDRVLPGLANVEAVHPRA